MLTSVFHPTCHDFKFGGGEGEEANKLFQDASHKGDEMLPNTEMLQQHMTSTNILDSSQSGIRLGYGTTNLQAHTTPPN